VGIGTNLVYSYLTINTPGGTTWSDGTVGLHGILIGSQSSGSEQFYMGVDENITSAYLQSNIRGAGATPILLNPSGGNIGIGLTAPSAKLTVRSSIANSTIVRTDGVVGEIFTATDNLVGSLFSVNDISGIPVFEAFSDNTILMGDYQAPSLYTTTKQVRAAGLVNSTIYQFSATTYTSAHIDYNVQSGLSTRAGTIVAIWNGTNLEYNETSTQDIGSGTGAITLNVSLSGTNVLLSATTAVGGGIWTIKAIIRAV
jgi:hypothetical protein